MVGQLTGGVALRIENAPGLDCETPHWWTLGPREYPATLTSSAPPRCGVSLTCAEPITISVPPQSICDVTVAYQFRERFVARTTKESLCVSSLISRVRRKPVGDIYSLPAWP